MSDVRPDDVATPKPDAVEEEPITAEFELLEAELDEPVSDVEHGPNPRELLSDEELGHHLDELRSVAEARENALHHPD